jgi:hypothetical protein
MNHLLPTVAAASLCLTAAASAGSATMAFDMEMFDLQLGEVQGCFLDPCVDADFGFAYNADTPNPVRLFQNQVTTTVALLDGSPYDAVECDAVAKAQFTDQLLDEPMDADDTMLIETADGNVYKIGNVLAISDELVSFSYALLSCGSCRWDLNGDHRVDQLDLIEVILEWGQSDSAADVSNNGSVGVDDLIEIVNNWGSCREVD